MRSTTVPCIAALTCLLALTAPDAAAQRHLAFGPTWQQSFGALGSGAVDPVLGQERFHAWGFMVGLERPGRVWQPHLWLQRYELGQPCEAPSDHFDCTNQGWALSVGPGLELLDTPELQGTFLPQVGIQGRAGGLTGGAGLHVGVKVGVIRPTAFARYHVMRGVHYGTVGGGVILRLPLREG